VKIYQVSILFVIGLVAYSILAAAENVNTGLITGIKPVQQLTVPVQKKAINETAAKLTPAIVPPQKSAGTAKKKIVTSVPATKQPAKSHSAGLSKVPMPGLLPNNLTPGKPVVIPAINAVRKMPVPVQILPAKPANSTNPYPGSLTPAPMANLKTKSMSVPHGHQTGGFASVPIPGTAQPIRAAGGFAPAVQLKSSGVAGNKSVTGPGGKSLLPPQLDPGSLHVLGDEPITPHDGFSVPLNGATVDVPQVSMKVTVWQGSSANVLAEVNLGDRVHVRIAVQNLGTAATPPLSVTSSRYGNSGPFTLSARGERPDEITFDFNDTVTVDHMDGTNTAWFTGSFSLQTAEGANFNHRVPGESRTVDKIVPVKAHWALAVTEVSDVYLGLEKVPIAIRRNLPGHLKNELVELVHARVTIHNSGSQASAAGTLRIKLESTQGASRPHSTDHVTVTFIMSSGNFAPSGTQTVEISIPSMPAGETLSQDVTFNRVLHDLWDRDYSHRVLGIKKHSHSPVAAGAFACSGHGVVDNGSAFRITAAIPASVSGSGAWQNDSIRSAEGRFGEDSGSMKCTGNINFQR